MKSFIPFLIASTAASALAGDVKSPAQSSGDWEFSLSAGPAWRQSGTLEFRAGSYSPDAAIPSFVGNAKLVTPDIGKDDGYSNRTYDDGYVRRDGGTRSDGYTTNWGYQNPGQVDGDDISFHATGFQSIRTDTVTRTNPPSMDRGERSIAPLIEFAGRSNRMIAGFTPGFSASFLWSPVRTSNHWSDFTLEQRREDFIHHWTDVYNLGGFGNFVPGAPYSGSGSAPGFVLENIPDSRHLDADSIGTDSAVFTNSVSSRFTADHTTVSFGPTLGRKITPQWNVEAGAGVSLHWLHWSASQSEKLGYDHQSGSGTFKEWSDNESGDKLLGGVYLQIASEWTPSEDGWSLKGLIRADLGQTFTKHVGPSRVSYDLHGFTAALMFGHPL